MKKLVLVALLLALGCKGPMGPEGPEGPPGANAGGGSHLVFSGDLDASGGAVVELPAEAGTIDDPPGVTCYVKFGSTSWIIVGSSALTGTCSILERDSHLAVFISQASSFQEYKVVVLF